MRSHGVKSGWVKLRTSTRVSRKARSSSHRITIPAASWEMQERGEVGQEEYKVRVLDLRQEMTGADRQWAGQYEPGDVVRY
jgi:hypothetical protein